MIDLARITVKAGDGGDGAVSFLKMPGMRHGKPDGGDGGKGGDVYVLATNDLRTLEPFRYVKHYTATNGGGGASNHRRGKDGEDVVIKVPVGTIVKVLGPKSQVTSWYDLTSNGQQVLVARGGKGGKGNSRFKQSHQRNFRYAEKGQEGEVKELILELKLIADVGIIGLPNSGKSTLLSVLTRARPKIANYPFTTLEPHLGVLKWQKDKSASPQSLVLADIPGLIEGASKGKGLGDEFLRHVERTKVLVHLIDASTPTDKWADFNIIKNELKAYNLTLARKKQIVVLSKIDAASPDSINAITKQFSRHKVKLLKISALTGDGLNLLVKEIFAQFAKDGR